MKGILLAGGYGTRLYPATIGLSKQVLPIYDKPMVYYPLSVLMLTGIRDVLLISQSDNLPIYQRILGCGDRYGINLCYAAQDLPRGIADAFIVGEKFVGSDSVCLVLGDNIFYGQGFSPTLKRAVSNNTGATVFGYRVMNPRDFGVAEIGGDGLVKSLEEKPATPKSNIAVTGLYFYQNDVLSIAKGIQPSERGELEITSVNNEYLKQNRLRIEVLGRGFAWLDTGTPKSLLDAAHFIETVETRQGIKIACLEEIAWSNGWISQENLADAVRLHGNSDYGRYLGSLATTSSTGFP